MAGVNISGQTNEARRSLQEFARDAVATRGKLQELNLTSQQYTAVMKELESIIKAVGASTAASAGLRQFKIDKIGRAHV